MAWIESHSNMLRDYKVRRVGRALTHRESFQLHIGVGIVIAAWCWALRTDHLTTPFTARELAAGLEWTGTDDQLFRALQAGDFLEPRGAAWQLTPYPWIRVRGTRLAGRRVWDRLRAWLAPLVLERDGAICRHCGTTDSLTIDHIVPIARNGSHDLDNLQVLCQPCNSRKGAR